jgi:putative membrane protein
VTRLRWRLPSLLFLAWIAVGALAALLGMSGPAVFLVTEHRWIMYSLFVGMTLGGAPDLWRQSRPIGTASGLALLLGFALMALFAFQLSTSAVPATIPVLLTVGALAASSMILPGISGSYILLIFGLYDLVIGSLRPAVLREDPREALMVLGPVGVGAVLGIALLANVLRALLARRPAPTHAALLGLLLGSILGLWPFQEAVHPELVDRDSRKAVEALLAGEAPAAIEARLAVSFDEQQAQTLIERYAGRTPGELRAHSNELRRFRPAWFHVLWALLLFAAGFWTTRRLRPRSAPSPGAAP